MLTFSPDHVFPGCLWLWYQGLIIRVRWALIGKQIVHNSKQAHEEMNLRLHNTCLHCCDMFESMYTVHLHTNTVIKQITVITAGILAAPRSNSPESITQHSGHINSPCASGPAGNNKAVSAAALHANMHSTPGTT